MTVRWRGRHVFDRLVVRRAEGGPFDQIGQVYHINTASATYPGSDSNEGTSFEKPMLTIDGALDRCVAGRSDYILIHDYWRPSGEAAPVVVNKRAVHIMGVALPNLPYPAIHPLADLPALVLGSAGQYSEIAYLTIGGGDTYGGINIEHYTGQAMQGQVDGVWIHHNTFGHVWFGTPACGIQKLATSTHPSHAVLIEDNEFLGDLANCVGAITGNAIDLLPAVAARAVKNWTIRRNRFKGCYIGVNAVYGYDLEVSENLHIVADAVAGEAITLASTVAGAMVVDNKAMNGMLNAGYNFNPFRDLATNTVNHWGRNFRGNTVIEPVGA